MWILYAILILAAVITLSYYIGHLLRPTAQKLENKLKDKPDPKPWFILKLSISGIMLACCIATIVLIALGAPLSLLSFSAAWGGLGAIIAIKTLQKKHMA